MIKKLDEKLQHSFLLKTDDYIECLVYINDFHNARLYFAQKNIKIINEFKFINAMAIGIDNEKILNLVRQDFVKFISSTAKVTALIDVSKKILNIGNSYLGDNVTIAFIDTGIASHFDFVLGKNRIKKFYDCINKKELNYDDNGHGTFVSGVCCGNGCESNYKFAGIVPNSEIVSVKSLDEKGEANAVKILQGMEWVYDNYKTYGIKVVCMSFGSQPLGFNDPILRGAEKLWDKGIIVVAAAGNSGPEYSSIKSPGVSSKIITVGGLNDNRIGKEYYEEYFEIAKFSSRGPALSHYKPDVIAPAVDITSCNNIGGYIKLSGTSVATPMIAGLCAILTQKFPTYNANQIKKILMSCCKKIVYNRNLEGAGYPDFSKFI